MKKNTTKSRYFLILGLFALVSFNACSDEETKTEQSDKVETAGISKLGAVETVLTTEHISDTQDVLITTHKVWKDNQLVSEKRHVDTVPALPVSSQSAADAQGNETTATGKKDYEFYITVK
jgi:hypothetical protein